MKITRNQLRQIINEALMLNENEDRVSEMREFSGSRGGKRVMSEGRKIRASGESIRGISEEHTGAMRRTLGNIAEFVEKLGGSLEGIGILQETESATTGLPTVSELKRLHKEIQKLEK
jgi:hypothetical protein|tara:strand:+ start:233 stop:586 length:354 start_codon:yes stop_codon:yes gene_type:complete